VVQSGWSIKQDPSSKITRAKRAGGMAQAVECLITKGKVRSSNPSTGQPKKEKRKKKKPSQDKN
jgi:hypothetical protein